eukprot:scaffold42270_cov30-Tisochrysis_lutea.AAC.8
MAACGSAAAFVKKSIAAGQTSGRTSSAHCSGPPRKSAASSHQRAHPRRELKVGTQRSKGLPGDHTLNEAHGNGSAPRPDPGYRRKRDEGGKGKG